MYKDFLSKYINDFDHVLLTDVRDVVFQSDPFETPLKHVQFAVEANTIGSDPNWNSRWIREVFGEEILQQVFNEIVCCAGTTAGPTSAIHQYLTDMTELMSRADYDRAHNYDQGFHNYLIRVLRPAYAALDHNFRYFATLGTVRKERIKISSNQLYLDDFPSPIVHQWDRHPFAIEWVECNQNFVI